MLVFTFLFSHDYKKKLCLGLITRKKLRYGCLGLSDGLITLFVCVRTIVTWSVKRVLSYYWEKFLRI